MSMYIRVKGSQPSPKRQDRIEEKTMSIFRPESNWLKPAELKRNKTPFRITRIETGTNTFEGKTTERWIFTIEGDEVLGYEGVIGISKNAYRNKIVANLQRKLQAGEELPLCYLSGDGKAYCFEEYYNETPPDA